jgi:hypothetical protein
MLMGQEARSLTWRRACVRACVCLCLYRAAPCQRESRRVARLQQEHAEEICLLKVSPSTHTPLRRNHHRPPLILLFRPMLIWWGFPLLLGHQRNYERRIQLLEARLRDQRQPGGGTSRSAPSAKVRRLWFNSWSGVVGETLEVS